MSEPGSTLGKSQRHFIPDSWKPTMGLPHPREPGFKLVADYATKAESNKKAKELRDSGYLVIPQTIPADKWMRAHYSLFARKKRKGERSY